MGEGGDPGGCSEAGRGNRAEVREASSQPPCGRQSVSRQEDRLDWIGLDAAALDGIGIDVEQYLGIGVRSIGVRDDIRMRVPVRQGTCAVCFTMRQR